MLKIRPPRHKIALFLPDLSAGGAEKVMQTLANEIVRRGYEVDFLLVRAQGALLAELSPTVKVIDLKAAKTYLSVGALVRYFRSEAPVVLLSTLHAASVCALIARRLSGRPPRIVVRVATTVSAQRRVFWKKWLEQLLLSQVYAWADKIVAVSQNIALDLEGFLSIPPGRISTIYNPTITNEMISKANESLSHPWFQPGLPPVILGVGRLTWDKDFANLITAFSIVRTHMDARLVILGEGKERSNLENLARRLGVGQDVDMIGYVENPFMYMKRASLFVLSSLWEGLPNVVIEALACGCPVVSADCPGGMREILAGGKYGTLVPVGDSMALADAIVRNLGAARRNPDQGWLDQFTPHAVIPKYLNVLLDSAN